MEKVFALVQGLERGNDLINFLLGHLDIAEHVFDGLKELFFPNPDPFAFPFEVRTAVVDVATLFEFGSDSPATLVAMDHPSENKGLSGVFDGLLLEAIHTTL